MNSSVLKWPEGSEVREAARKWAIEVLRDPNVKRAGYFGSYAQGREGVGSDLDLVVVLESAELPFARRGLLFDTSSLPVPEDLLVYSDREFQEILARGDRFSRELGEHAVWFTR